MKICPAKEIVNTFDWKDNSDPDLHMVQKDLSGPLLKLVTKRIRWSTSISVNPKRN